MRLILLPLLMIALAPSVLRADQDLIAELSQELTKIGQDLGKGAKVVRTGERVDLTFRTRTFFVHGSSKSGRYDLEPHKETGPSIDGLMVRIWLNEGVYNGQAMIPQTLNQKYWKTQLHQVPVSEGQQHLRLNLSYGARPNKEVLAKVVALVHARKDAGGKAAK